MSTMKDKILKFKNVKTEKVVVSEWDNMEIQLKGLRGSQLDAVMEASTATKTKSDMMFNLIILCAVDEKGEAIWSKDDLQELKDMPMGPIQKLGTKCMEINGFTSNLEDSKKN